MNPLTWQNPGQLFVAQDVIKVNIYSVAELRKNSIILDDEKADIVTFTSNSLKFTLDGENYSGTRIVQKDKQLVESNKKHF